MKTLIALTLLILSFNLSAQNKDYFSISPIVGYERVQKVEPTPHTKSRLIYGVRASYGPPIFAAEAEITRGSDDENFPDRNLTIEETATNAMLGVRSSFNIASALRWYVRGGGHARKREITRTQDEVTTEQDPAVYVSPYAGSGLNINLFNKLTLNAGITVIFTGEPKGSDHEYQTTLGFGIKI